VDTEPGFDILKKADMNTQVNKPMHLPLLIGGIAAILVGGIAIGSLALSAQGFNGSVRCRGLFAFISAFFRVSKPG
jgi:hypothetical protein